MSAPRIPGEAAPTRCPADDGGARQGLWMVALSVLVLLVTLLHVPTPAAGGTPTLVLSPGTTVVGVGGTNGFWAVYDKDGGGGALPKYLDPTKVIWSSSDPLVLTMTQYGFAYGVAPGIVTVKAKYAGLVAKATVVVAGTLTKHSFDTPDGRTRTYLLYVPDGYQPGTPTPLVLAFHGLGGTGRAMMHTTQLDTVARKNNFIVAYPNGVGSGSTTSWNAGACCGDAVTWEVDDVGFTRLLIEDISSQFAIDPDQVYATGLSNGAAFVHRLGSEAADVIAAIAPVAGAATPGGDFTPTAPIRPVSVMEFHGTTDQDAPYSPAVPTTIKWWRSADNISMLWPATTYQYGIETCNTYSSTLAEVTLCTARPPLAIIINGVVYDGGGHAWPGGVRFFTANADYPTYDINASGAMWKFFLRHPRQ